MIKNKLIVPGKWHIEYNEAGKRISHVHEDSTITLLGYADKEEYINAQVSWEDAIHPDDLPELLRYIADLESKHPEGMDYDAEYRIMTKQGYHWVHDCGHVLRREDGSPIRIDGAAFDIQDIIDKQATAEQLEESLAFSSFFLNTYVSAYFVDLDTCVCRVYLRTEELKKNYPVIDNYLVGLTEYINRDVHPDDRAKLISILSPDNLKRKLKETSDFSHIFRDLSGNQEKYYRVQVIRGVDALHAALGFIDVTEEYREQQSRLLGAIPLSSDVLTKANIGLWSFELDEGCEPRMYADKAMLGLIGLDHQISPEETYHAWYDNIDDGSYDLVADAVAKMISGEHAEVQYPWHHPNGETWIVRCGGVRNPEYTKGIRIEGTHQNVTELIHFDEKERARAKKLESDLAIEKLRTEALSFIADHEPNLDEALDFFGERILALIECDQVIFHEINGKRILRNAPGISELPQEICSKCPIRDLSSDVYGENDVICINDCNDGYRGVTVHPECPVKSAYIQRIYSGGELEGLFSVHYINKQHTFSDNDLEILKMVAVCLGLMIGRVKEKQEEIARIEAESSSKAKTTFLFNMSHDIRTPMNAIIGFNNMAVSHIDDKETVANCLKKVGTSSKQLLSLINDVLDMARIESGTVKCEFEPVDIVDAGIELMDIVKQSVQKKLDIEVDFSGIEHRFVLADHLHCDRIFTNIISNSVKYTPEGGYVKFTAKETPSSRNGFRGYDFTIEDNGIGMSEEFLEHIYEEFSREKTSTVSGVQGTGLGMAITKRLVDLLGGTINIQSKLGEGTRTTIHLEMETADPDKISEEYAESDIDEAILKGVKILLVEDNELNREIALDILNEEGMIVDTAEDGDIAVEKMKNAEIGQYDIILMDVQMPRMNGYEATKAIRALPDMYASTVPIIAMTANAFEEDKQNAFASGMNGHIAKPIDVPQLKATIAKFV